MRKVLAVGAIAILASVAVTGRARAVERGTYVMNTTKSEVTLIFRGNGSQATVEEVEAGGKRVVKWNDQGAATPRIEIIGCGKKQTITYTLSTTHSVLYLSGECSPYLQPGNN